MVKRTRTYKRKHSRRNLKRSRKTGRGQTTLKAMFTGKSGGPGFSRKKHLPDISNVKLPELSDLKLPVLSNLKLPSLPRIDGLSHQPFLSFFTGKDK